MNNNRLWIGAGLTFIAICQWDQMLYSVLSLGVIGVGTAYFIYEEVQRMMKTKRSARLAWKGEG